MTTEKWLKEATQSLTRAGIGTARLDALVLLEDITGVQRAKLLAEPGMNISSDQQAKLKKLLIKRTEHIPLAHVRGRTEFYGHTFLITPAVLEPRPESEDLIDLFKDLAKSGLIGTKKGSKLRVADVGTGSGAIGITAKLEVPEAKVDLIDIDNKAIKIAQMNVDKFTLPLTVIESDLLSIAGTQYDVLLCNLPYVPDDYQINLAASHEPRLAIFGGKDGLDVYRRLFQQLKTSSKEVLYILCESLPPQHQGLKTIAEQNGFRMDRESNFIQQFSRTK